MEYSKLSISLPTALLKRTDRIREDVPRSTFIQRALQEYESNMSRERICKHCHESKPWDEFEPMLVLQHYRVSWFKDCLLSIKEFLQREEENDKTDKEKIAWYKNGIKTAEHILKTIDVQYNSPNHWVEIPVNDYERDWLKDQFTQYRRYCLKHLKNKRKNQLSLVEFECDLKMINHILNSIAISYMDKCNACRISYMQLQIWNQ